MGRVLIIGGSGVLGSALLDELAAAQLDFLVGSRRPTYTATYGTVRPIPVDRWRQLDLATGVGFTKALAGVDTVVQLASDQRRVGAEPFETVAMRHLLAAARPAAVRQVLYVSIVGVDKIPFSYYQTKRAAEIMLERSGLPYTILRATQFHPFVDSILAKLLRWPIGVVPVGMQLQPIAPQVVAQRLRQLVQCGPRQGIDYIAGPEILDGHTLANQWLAQRHAHRLVLPLPSLGSVLRGFAHGEATRPAAAVPSQTWADYLSSRNPVLAKVKI